MPDTEYVSTVIDGVPVVVTPEEIDITTADQLRAVLLVAASGEQSKVIVDMTHTQFCDSAGLHTLLRARQQARADNRELRLVVCADGAIPRMLALTGLDRVIPSFISLEEALASPYARST